MVVYDTAAESGRFHGVRFYQDSASLARSTANFLAEGFLIGQPALVLATPAHREAIARALQTRGLEVERIVRSGDLTMLDAATVLEQFTIDGTLDERRFDDTVTPVIDQIADRHDGGVLRAYGEMVDLLWQAGQKTAAVKLEMLWNELAQRRSFSLLCGYAASQFSEGTAIEEIFRQHTHVLSDGGDTKLVMM